MFLYVLSYFQVLIGNKFKSSELDLKRLIEQVPTKRKANKQIRWIVWDIFDTSNSL
jgi:hypothetical protein